MSLFQSKSITSEVGGQSVEFFSLSFPVLFQLKSAVGPIAKVLATFFRNTRQDIATLQEDKRDENGAPLRTVQQLPLSIEMAKLRAEQSSRSMQDALDAVFADQNRLLIGRILMDSMRNNCPRKPDNKQIEEFLADLDLGQVMEMLQGVVKANAEVFGPLVSGWAKKGIDHLRAQASSASPISPAPESSESNARPAQPEAQLDPKG